MLGDEDFCRDLLPIDGKAGFLLLQKGHNVDETLPYASHFTDEVLAEEPLVCQKILGEESILDGSSKHLNGRLWLFHKEFFCSFMRTVSRSPSLAEAIPQLPSGQAEILFPASLGMKGEVKRDSALLVSDGKQQQFIAKYTFLSHMVKHSADAFHAESALLKRGVVQDKVALLVCFH